MPPTRPTPDVHRRYSPISSIQISSEQRKFILNIASQIARRLVQQREVARRQSKTASGAEVWLPRVDLIDDPKQPHVVALFEMPGVTREDARVTVLNGTLTIEGVRKFHYKQFSTSQSVWVSVDGDATGIKVEEDMETDSPAQQAATIPRSVAELRYGRFRRSMKLPGGVTASDVRVLLENGMLHVQWPREARRPSSSNEATSGSPK